MMEQSKKASTITDVARRAGVAVGTVSRFLNGYHVREKNRLQIEKAIRELDYRENFLAKTFKTKRTLTIGAVIGSFDLYHIRILQTLENIFSQNGYNLIICQHEQDKTVLVHKLEFLLDRYIDGVIYSPIPVATPILEDYQKRGVPVIFFNEQVPNISTDFVCGDSKDAARQAVSYCIENNHSKIGIINGPSEYGQAKERFEGYRRAHHEHGLPIRDEYLFVGDWFEESGYAGAKKMLRLKDPPSVLFVANHVMTTGALRAVKEAGLTIPDDISIVSFDDTEFFQLHRPGINAIEQPVIEMGKKITEIMFRRLSGDYSGYPEKVMLPSRFIVRESVSRIE